MKKVVRLIFLTTTWLLLIFAMFELGMWQLHRAQDMAVATAPKADQPLIELTQIASAGMNLPIKAVNRIVSAAGSYSKSYIAPDQKLANQQIVDLDVRLLKLESGHAILVARGVAGNSPELINSPVAVTGRLYPRQNVDRALSVPRPTITY